MKYPKSWQIPNICKKIRPLPKKNNLQLLLIQLKLKHSTRQLARSLEIVSSNASHQGHLERCKSFEAVQYSPTKLCNCYRSEEGSEAELYQCTTCKDHHHDECMMWSEEELEQVKFLPEHNIRCKGCESVRPHHQTESTPENTHQEVEASSSNFNQMKAYKSRASDTPITICTCSRHAVPVDILKLLECTNCEQIRYENCLIWSADCMRRHKTIYRLNIVCVYCEKKPAAPEWWSNTSQHEQVHLDSHYKTRTGWSS